MFCVEYFNKHPQCCTERLLTLGFRVAQDLENLSVDGVLAESPHDIPALAEADLAIARAVEQEESLFEL